MKSFDFYEFVGILLPGSAFLVATGFLFDVKGYTILFFPNDLGSFGLHVFAAYILGHLIQAIGNFVEKFYWMFWKGMPTDWPFTKPNNTQFITAKDTVISLCQGTTTGLTLEKWRSYVAQSRSVVFSRERSSRLNFFNGNYGLFRGLISASLLLASFSWSSEKSLLTIYLCLFVVSALSFYRMHRFGVHYASELFANVQAIKTECIKESG